ncbi:MAG: glycosyltransferase family 39 protein [Phycisphaeraceae bacterium]|nr:glycosyltransferase family 39 protein [Phycisphaeraceae bacterium]
MKRPCTPSASTDVDACAPSSAERLPTPRQCLALLLLYFALHVLVRYLLSSTSLEVDEAEQFILSQRWSWGYSTQPPLYTWLQTPILRGLGVSVLSLSILKHVLLLSVYVLTYANAHRLIGTHRGGLAAAASLLFIQEFAWDPHRDLTHTILALTAINATLLCFLRVVEHRRRRDYLLLGLFAALSLLSKYNSSFFLVGLLLAAISVPSYRGVVLDRRMLLAAAALLVTFAPHAVWLWRNPDLALMTSYKLRVADAGLNSLGLGRLGLTLFRIFGPMLVLHCFLFSRWSTDGPRPVPPANIQLMLRTAIVVILLIVAALLIFRVTNVRSRWVAPSLVFLPILSVALHARCLDARRVRIILALAGAVMLVVLTGAATRLVWSGRVTSYRAGVTLPYAELADQMRPHLEGLPFVLTDSLIPAGNLGLNLPGPLYAPPEFIWLIHPRADRVAVVQVLIPPSETSLARLTRYVQQAGLVPEGPPRIFQAPWHTSGLHYTLSLQTFRKESSDWPSHEPLPR